MDDFGIEYFRKEHADHLASVLKKYHNITQDWTGKKYAGIDLAWNYKVRVRICRLTMDRYIQDVLRRYGHPTPKKLQLSPHKHHPIFFGAKTQYATEDEHSPPLDAKGVRRVQGIVGSLLYIARAVNNKLLVGLSAIGAQQANTTEATSEAIDQLLDYVTTYPNDGITYRASNMVLCGHYDAAYFNETKSRSCACAYIFLSEDDAFP